MILKSFYEGFFLPIPRPATITSDPMLYYTQPNQIQIKCWTLGLVKNPIRAKKMKNIINKGTWIENTLHGMASVSFVVWLVGFFGYQLGNWFFGLLAFPVITAIILLYRQKR